jgi:AcrR family transcriptional regulator
MIGQGHAEPKSVGGGRHRDRSVRYTKRRDGILDVATRLLNEKGVSGMTFADLARSLSLSTTSINYYFGSKEELAVAVIANSLERLDVIVREAGKEATPHARVRRYVRMHFALWRRAAAGECRPFANLSEIRTLDGANKQVLLAQYQGVFRSVRGMFGPSQTPSAKAWNTARAHILNETLFWAERWLCRYAPEDADKVADRLCDVLDGGVAPHSMSPGPDWVPSEPKCEQPQLSLRQTSRRQDREASFLPAATRLINEFGYRGASIERIVAELKVTKGSFYHHLDAKDDLVLECFQRSYERTMATLRCHGEKADSAWTGLSNAIAALLALQFDSEFPLMRSSALQATPVPVQTAALALLERNALHIGGVLSDGMRDGSVRVCDPLIASQFLLSTINSSYDIRNWANRLGVKDAVQIYLEILQFGLLNARIS